MNNDQKNISELTDDELLVKKKELKKSKIMNAFIIGFLGGIVVIGSVSSLITKNWVAIIPLLFPIYFIHLIVKSSKKNKELELFLKKRNLD